MSRSVPIRCEIDVQPTRCTLSDDGRRIWNFDIRHSQLSEVKVIDAHDFPDPFTADQYDAVHPTYTPRLRRESPSLVSLPSGDEESFSSKPNATATQPDIDGYHRDLHKLLKLHMLPRGCNIKVYISEDHDLRECSCRGINWELLEDDEQLSATDDHDGGLQHTIQVVRFVTSVRQQFAEEVLAEPHPRSMPQGLRQADEPIRLLLVFARSFKRGTDMKLSDMQSVVLTDLCAMVKHVRSRWQPERFHVDVVRPGSLEALRQYLGCMPKYDMVHLDMHGVEENGQSFLLFAKADCYEQEIHKIRKRRDLSRNLYDYHSPATVADVLTSHGVAVIVLNACFSSGGGGGASASASTRDMCRTFAERGVKVVTGMSLLVDSAHATAYCGAFYGDLVLGRRSFRDAAFSGRRAQQRSQMREREELSRQQLDMMASTPSLPLARTWPNVTTYIMTRQAHRTDSDLAAVDATATGHWLPRAIELVMVLPFLLRRWLLRVLHRGTAVIGYGEGPLWSAACQPDVALQRFRAGPTGQLLEEHGMGVLALEDRLRAHDTLFLTHGDPNLRIDFERLREPWMLTNFASSVNIVPARRFNGPIWLALMLLTMNLADSARRLLCRLPGFGRDTDDGFSAPPQAEAAVQGGGSGSTTARHRHNPAPRAVLIITMMSEILQDDYSLPPEVLDRITTYINAVTKHEPLYLIFSGDDGVPWDGAEWKSSRHPWTAGKHFSGTRMCLPLRRV